MGAEPLRLRYRYDEEWVSDWERVAGEMLVMQRAEHTLGYLKARILEAFLRYGMPCCRPYYRSLISGNIWLYDFAGHVARGTNWQMFPVLADPMCHDSAVIMSAYVAPTGPNVDQSARHYLI